MGFEDNVEKGQTNKKPPVSVKMTLQKAVDMGEYNPEYLSTFPEWHTFSRHLQFQFIKTAIDNRRKQLFMQYADMNNVLDYSLKPEMQKASKNVLEQIKKLDKDEEILLIQYSKI